MKIFIMHQTITDHDAIGNDIEAMYKILNSCCKDNCFAYAENKLNKNINYVTYDDLIEGIQNTDSTVIYHHSIFWQRGYDILKKAKSKIIIRYHNITPPEFFAPYNHSSFLSCKQGRSQTNDLIKEFPNAFWISDSYFNAKDLVGVNNKNLTVIPPFHIMDKIKDTIPNEKTIKKLIESPEINILFVGRLAPNKGHLFLLDVVKIFNNSYKKKIKLFIIGKRDTSLNNYADLIITKIKQFRIEKYVEIVGEANDEELFSYYLGCDFYINASEHEGFCVPVLEAQVLGLPVIALNKSAVPETMGNNRLLLEPDPKKFAAAIKILFDNEKMRNYLIGNGLKNYYSRFKLEKIKMDFIKIIKQVIT